MLAKVVDPNKGELENHYNGIGFRVASTRPEEKIEYLCDLSRDYYNLLERTVDGETESFIYDNNVVSMSKAGSNYYYLQDELGSPMYMTGTDGIAVSSYAFDDFGRNIGPFTGKIKEANSKHAYTTDGNIIQPFAFTGYQEDEVSGLKFAQARFYSSENGRFVGEDQVRGFIEVPDSINHYLYCFNNSVMYVDVNGLIILLDVFLVVALWIDIVCIRQGINPGIKGILFASISPVFLFIFCKNKYYVADKHITKKFLFFSVKTIEFSVIDKVVVRKDWMDGRHLMVYVIDKEKPVFDIDSSYLDTAIFEEDIKRRHKKIVD